jgi:hypothetical protein
LNQWKHRVRRTLSTVESSKGSVKSSEASVKSPEVSVKSSEATVKSAQGTVKSAQGSVKSAQATVKSPETTVKSPVATAKSPVATVKSPEASLESPALGEANAGVRALLFCENEGLTPSPLLRFQCAWGAQRELKRFRYGAQAFVARPELCAGSECDGRQQVRID